MNEKFKGAFGIERETLRVDSEGKLAQTPHPFGDNESITRDFCENQIELITPVCDTIEGAVSELAKLDSIAREKIAENGESIWLYSNPPHFNDESDIPIADFTGMHSGKRLYREQLERRYGKRLMLFSGIHFNFSFSQEYLEKLSGGKVTDEFRNALYLRLYKQLSLHSWLILLLTAASPVYDKSLFADGASGSELGKYSSVRSGEKGYWNEFVPTLDPTTLDSFVDSIQYYVDKGLLFSASEVYLPVRLKPFGENNLENLRKGISHIELRMFDLDPLEDVGINADDLRFAYLLAVYLAQKGDADYSAQAQQLAVQNHKNAALYDLTGVTIDGVDIIENAAQIIDDMTDFFADCEQAKQVLSYERSKLTDRLCERVAKQKIYK
ncbi:MAG: glutathione synthase [Ruminococcus sp.]|nr:glutathione synthase [Ruminococcus sp.]